MNNIKPQDDLTCLKTTKVKIILNFASKNVVLVKLMKSLSSWKIQRLKMFGDQLIQEIEKSNKKFGSARFSVAFFFDANRSMAKISLSNLRFKYKTPYTYDLIKPFIRNDCISRKDLRKVAHIKLPDLNTNDIEKAIDIIANGCKSYHIKVINKE